jgi:hypothetical protein
VHLFKYLLEGQGSADYGLSDELCGENGFAQSISSLHTV